MAYSRDIVKDYYRAALDEPGDTNSQSVWSGGQIPSKPYLGSLAKFGIGVGGVFAAGSLQLPNGGRVWDKYVGALRNFEEYFPAKIPRTLQLSNLFSRFETSSLQQRIITPDQISGFSAGQISYLEKLTGRGSYDLLNQGIRFQDGKLYLNTSGEALLSNAGVVRNITGSHHLSTANARSLGASVTGETFAERLKFTNSAGKEVEEAFQFVGGHTKTQSILRQLGGIGTEAVERANRLARMMSPKLAVKSGSGLQTLGRMIGKWGVLGGAAILGYQTLDWKVRNTDALNDSIFDKGITAAGANLWAKANLLHASFGETTGWTDYAKKQEEYAPGSTSLTKLSAFPIMGALAGATTGYLMRVANVARVQARGRTIDQATKIVDRAMHNFGTSKDLFSTIGKTLRESNWKIFRRIGRSRTNMSTVLGAAIGMLPILPFLPGALAPTETEQELHDIYTGKKEVAVRKGRFWELGRSAYEGGNIQYFRPHLVAKILQDGKNKQIWGPLEKDGELSPLNKWYKSNFTYDVEQAHYYDRPYPVTGRSFASVPIIGDLLAATVGNFVKPQMAMHNNEYYNSGTGDYFQPPASFGSDRNTQLGEQLPGSPINGLDTTQTIGRQLYRLKQLVGLPGYLAGVVKQQITGSPDFFDQAPVLQSADDITSASRGYQDLNLGGMMFQNELFRRLLPPGRNQVETYNPIKNSMPDWLPGTGDRSPDFQHGDPFSLIQDGEIRLPGEGYASRFSELSGIDPNDYPLVHKYKILADVAPFSEKMDEVSRELAIATKGGFVSKEHQDLYWETKAQLEAKREKKSFIDYLYKEKNLGPIQQALTDYNNTQKAPSEGVSWFHKTMGSFWENLSHNAETPFEFLTPLSPAAKLIHQRTAVEDYQKTQLYGTGSAFWDRPIENFLSPFAHTLKHDVTGKNYVPDHEQQRRNLEEYFDILKYLKFTRLKNMAGSIGDHQGLVDFEQKRRETMFGVNPYTYAYTQIFRGLPRRERDYFTSFTETKDMDERARILQMVPENEKGLYIAKWRQSDATDLAIN